MWTVYKWHFSYFLHQPGINPCETSFTQKSWTIAQYGYCFLVAVVTPAHVHCSHDTVKMPLLLSLRQRKARPFSDGLGTQCDESAAACAGSSVWWSLRSDHIFLPTTLWHMQTLASLLDSLPFFSAHSFSTWAALCSGCSVFSCLSSSAAEKKTYWLSRQHLCTQQFADGKVASGNGFCCECLLLWYRWQSSAVTNPVSRILVFAPQTATPYCKPAQP